jgi:1,4-dihydroxy-6-naphthoate synthase
VRRSLPSDVQQAMNRVMRASVEYAFAHPDASRPFVRAHAQEMADEVMAQHIALYVNDYSVNLGAEGRRAIEGLFARGAAAGVIERPTRPLFVG